VSLYVVPCVCFYFFFFPFFPLSSIPSFCSLPSSASVSNIYNGKSKKSNIYIYNVYVCASSFSCVPFNHSVGGSISITLTPLSLSSLSFPSHFSFFLFSSPRTPNLFRFSLSFIHINAELYIAVAASAKPDSEKEYHLFYSTSQSQVLNPLFFLYHHKNNQNQKDHNNNFI